MLLKSAQRLVRFLPDSPIAVLVYTAECDDDGFVAGKLKLVAVNMKPID